MYLAGLTATAAAALGAVVGFLTGGLVNLVAARLGPQPGTCGYCGRQADWGGAWAVINYVRRKGVCPSCTAPLPLRPLLVELSSAVGLSLLWHQVGDGAGSSLVWRVVFQSAYLLVLLLVSVTDLEQRRIPDVVMVPALVLALLGAFLSPAGNWRNSLMGGAAAGAFFLLLYLLGKLVARWLRREGNALGGGDVKLATFVGLTTGLQRGAVALGLGIVLAGVVAGIVIVVRLLQGRYRPGMSMPYGPFLAAGAALVLLLAP